MVSHRHTDASTTQQMGLWHTFHTCHQEFSSAAQPERPGVYTVDGHESSAHVMCCTSNTTWFVTATTVAFIYVVYLLVGSEAEAKSDAVHLPVGAAS